jgi:hypothetical protein
MGPSFSSKNGVRYRFYVSTALRGHKHQAGSVTRISAPEIEGLVETAPRKEAKEAEVPTEELIEHVERIVVSTGRIRITLRDARRKGRPIDIAWTPKAKGEIQVHLAGPPKAKTNQKLLKSIVRAHVWLQDLSTAVVLRLKNWLRRRLYIQRSSGKL